MFPLVWVRLLGAELSFLVQENLWYFFLELICPWAWLGEKHAGQNTLLEVCLFRELEHRAVSFCFCPIPVCTERQLSVGCETRHKSVRFWSFLSCENLKICGIVENKHRMQILSDQKKQIVPLLKVLLCDVVPRRLMRPRERERVWPCVHVFGSGSVKESVFWMHTCVVPKLNLFFVWMKIPFSWNVILSPEDVYLTPESENKTFSWFFETKTHKRKTLQIRFFFARQFSFCCEFELRQEMTVLLWMFFMHGSLVWLESNPLLCQFCHEDECDCVLSLQSWNKNAKNTTRHCFFDRDEFWSEGAKNQNLKTNVAE